MNDENFNEAMAYWKQQWDEVTNTDELFGNKSNRQDNGSSASKKVTITVTNIEDGWGVVRSYPDKNGKNYQVPIYHVTVSGKQDGIDVEIVFNCIRFGVQYDADKGIGPKVVGLKNEQSHPLGWVYSRTSKSYVWQVKETWLIHKGADYPQRSAVGAIGCVEIVGKNEWNKFNKTILELTGEPDENEVAKKKLAIVEFQEVSEIPPLIEKS